jgi:hypothetical protein
MMALRQSGRPRPQHIYEELLKADTNIARQWGAVVTLIIDFADWALSDL